MKSANVAYQETKYAKEIMDFKKTIEESIDKAITHGNYCCKIPFSIDVPDSVRNKVRDELRRLGYKVNIPKHEDKPSECPSDQWKYFDEAIVNWGK